MPTYDYECETCGKRFEFFQSMKDTKLTHCPPQLCEKNGTVKRLLGTGSGLIFKGAGFYQTDYRSSSYQNSAKKESDATTPAKPTETKTPPPTAPSTPT